MRTLREGALNGDGVGECVSCSCLVFIIAPSRGGGLLLGENRSAEPTLGDQCLLYGPLPANAHPLG